MIAIRGVLVNVTCWHMSAHFSTCWHISAHVGMFKCADRCQQQDKFQMVEIRGVLKVVNILAHVCQHISAYVGMSKCADTCQHIDKV